MANRNSRVSTRAIHGGLGPDPTTGAILTPIVQSTTYVHDAIGVHKGQAMRTFFSLHRCGRSRRRRYSDFRRRFSRSLRHARWAATQSRLAAFFFGVVFFAIRLTPPRTYSFGFVTTYTTVPTGTSFRFSAVL